MTLITCASCKNWDKGNRPEANHGYCQSKKVIITRLFDPYDPTDYDSFGIEVDEGNCEVWFVTGKDFGCIHWKGKDSPR